MDFLPLQTGRPVRDVETWRRCPGGAPSNVAIGLARLGGGSALLGVIGADEFGAYLAQALRAEGVDTSHLRRTDEGKTGLAFVSLTEEGERSFSFHRTRSAELFLGEADIDLPFVLSASAVHLGTNSLLWRPAQEAVLKMAQAAKTAGKLVSCDPNLRLHLWRDPGELQALLGRLLPGCSVVKLSEDEVGFVTGGEELEGALRTLRERGVLLPVVTRAAQGAAFWWDGKVELVPGAPARVVDTTGAGDGFMAALLLGLIRLYPDPAALGRASAGELREVVGFACRAAARVVQEVGAVAGLPTLLELQDCLPKLLNQGEEEGGQ